jgi:hypothetical protein
MNIARIMLENQLEDGLGVRSTTADDVIRHAGFVLASAQAAPTEHVLF